MDMIGADVRWGWFSWTGASSEVNGKLLWHLKEHDDLVEPYELENCEGGRQGMTGSFLTQNYTSNP